jgi:glycosyltransferase involved in cell wall biosynthesis
VVPNGLADEAFVLRDLPRSDVVYLGRLETAQKGLDLLLEAWARVAPLLSDDLILAGDGPDEAALRAQVSALGLEGRVRFVGRVAGPARFDLLAGARVVAMPSRYETFGMVAAEALAVSTPVVAFDIPCLRNLVGSRTGIAVPAFDTDALADALVGLLSDPVLAADLGAGGPAAVATLRWDDLALRQADVYRRATGRAVAVAPGPVVPVLDRS